MILGAFAGRFCLAHVLHYADPAVFQAEAFHFLVERRAIDAELIGSGMFQENDIYTLGGRYADTATARVYTVDVSGRMVRSATWLIWRDSCRRQA